MKHLFALLALLLTLTSVQAAAFVPGGSTGCDSQQGTMVGQMVHASVGANCGDSLDDCERSCLAKHRLPLSYNGPHSLAPEQFFLSSRLSPPVLSGYFARLEHPPRL